jgi:hypothetical protein
MTDIHSIAFTYQHTCKEGLASYIHSRTPFPSLTKKGSKGKNRMPFLGEGYYLWEENISAAHNWGATHYKGKYSIVEFSDLLIPIDELFDFMNRRHLKYFNELIAFYIKKRPDSINWKIANWIQFFKSLNKLNPGKFPFKFFRADENLPDSNKNDLIKKKTKFINSQEYYTFLDPLIILCAIDKGSWNYKSKVVIK